MSISARASPVREMAEREQSLAERFRLIGEEWAEADAAHYMLETTRTSVRSEIVMKQVGVPNNRAQHIANASPEYREHVEKAADAKRRANILKVRMDYLRMRERKQDHEEWNARSERKMGRTVT
jgi:hypothetical protein